jgi:hypothetical protein
MAREKSSVTFFCKDYEDVTFDIKPTTNILQNNKLVIEHGKSVKFSNHQFTTDDPEAIKYLRGHEWYGIKIIEQEQPKVEKEPVKDPEE